MNTLSGVAHSLVVDLNFDSWNGITMGCNGVAGHPFLKWKVQWRRPIEPKRSSD